jgi:hypothetical protein
MACTIDGDLHAGTSLQSLRGSERRHSAARQGRCRAAPLPFVLLATQSHRRGSEPAVTMPASPHRGAIRDQRGP